MAAFVTSRVTGLLREVVIGHQFGTSREYEAYLAAMRIPDLVFQVFAGGAVASAFIPVFTSYLARDREDESWQVVNSLYTLAVLVLLPVVGLLALFSPQLIGLIAPGFDPSTQALAANLTRVVLVSPIFFTIGCFATSVLNSYQRFLLAALAPTMYNLGIIVGAALLAPLWGVYGLAAGAALGSVLFLLVQLPGLRRVGMVYRPRLDLRHEGVAAIGKLMLPRSFGLAVAQVNFLVALVLASGMAERYAALNYAWLLTTMPLGVFAMAISTAVFPTLAEHSARDELAALKRTLSTALRLILFLTIPASIGLIVLGEPITKLLFERGQFTPAATQATAFALQFYAPGLFALALIEILARAFYALKDTRTPVLVAILGMAVNTALGVLLIRTALGYGGLALAMMLAAAVESLVLLAVARRRLGGLEERRLAVALGKHCLAAILMGVAVYAFAQGLLGYLNPGLSLHLLLLVGSSMVVGVVSYVAVAAALRCEEVARVRQALPVGKVV